MAELNVASGRPESNRAPLLIGAMALTAAILSWHAAQARLDPAFWWQAAISPRADSVQEMLFHYAFLPRVCVSVIAGAMLGLSGFLFQEIFRNPLAEPTTLGVSTGAYLALTLASLLAPGAASAHQNLVALSGAGAALLLVFTLAARHGASPVTLLLTGLVVSLVCSTTASVLTLFHRESLTSIFIWNSGTLSQPDWSATYQLLPCLLAAGAAAMLLARPLELLALGDDGARSLGLSVRSIAWSILLVATMLSSFVVAAVGVIGFIGLAAPVVARLAGARGLRQRLIWAVLAGAALLWLADGAAELLSSPLRELRTGILTAVLGAPLMLILIWRLRTSPGQTAGRSGKLDPRRTRPWIVIVFGALFLALLAYGAVSLGKSLAGWRWSTGDTLQSLLPLRWPRVMAALSAGAMLAMAGTLMQRLTANAMASPEVLGISSGAACGVIFLAFLVAVPDKPEQVGAAAAGALVCLLGMLAIGRRAAFCPERLLLVGIALGTAFGALVAILMASGDPRTGMLLSWMAGSTYQVTVPDALLAMAIALVSLALMPLLSRWLEILPLGEATIRSLGVGLASSRFRLLLVTAILTGTATLTVGPLSFVGLMAPHMARMMGLQRPMPQICGSAVLGALIMLAADWLGRNMLFPYQVPAGLLATFVGGPYFMVLLWRKAR